MRVKSLYAGLLLSGLLSTQVPVEKEPRHRVVLENESLRVLEPQIPAGDTSLEHLHSHDEAFVCIHVSAARAKPQGGEWSAVTGCMPGQADVIEYTGNPRAHTVQNVGSDIFHVAVVDNLRPSGWTNHEALTVPRLKVVKESRSFRIYAAQLSGSGLAVHSHQVPTVVILVSGEVTADKRLNQPGQSAFIPAGKEHRITVGGNAQVIEIEVR